MESAGTDNIDWALPELPVSQASGISARISKELPLAAQGNKELSNGTMLALLARFVRTLVTRKVPELSLQPIFPVQSVYLGEGATYRVIKGRFGAHQLQEPEPKPKVEAAFKTAKILIPQHFADLQPTTEGYRRLKSVLFEVEILSHPAIQSHPNIVSIIGHSWFGLTGNALVPALALELAELGNARAFLANGQPTEVKMRLCGDVAAGLEFLHACKIIHGDVKLDNVLVFQTEDHGKFVAKISDFERSPQNSDTLSYTGTTCYNAPEVQEATRCPRSTHIDTEQLWLCDVFSYGLFVLEAFVNGTFYGSLQGGEKLLNQVILGRDLDGNDTMSLALRIADGELELSPHLLNVSHAVFEATLPSYPLDRLRDGWAGVRRLLGYQSNEIVDQLPVRVLGHWSQVAQASHSVLEIYSLPPVLRVSSSLGDGRVGAGLWSQLEEITTTSPNLEDKGRAAFGLFLCANVDRYGYAPDRIDTLQKALEGLTASADAGYPAAFIVGQRVFEANHLGVPDVLLRGPEDNNLRKTIKRLAQLPNNHYYSAAVQVFWPPALRDAARGSLLPLPEADDLFDMPAWVDSKIHALGGVAFKSYVEEHSLLHRAIINGSYATCKRLLLFGCNINAKMSGGITPISLACRCAEVDIILLLLENGADASLPDDNDALPIHWLVLIPGGDVSDWIVSRLADSCIRAGRSVDTPSQAFFDDLGLATSGNALGWAIQCRNINVIKTFLSKGIFDPAADQDNGKRYVRMAAATACAGTAECLLDHIKRQKGSSFEGFSKVLDTMFRVIGISTVDCSSDVHRWVMHGRVLDTAIGDFIDTLESFGGCMDPVAAFHTACDRSIPLMKELVRRGVDINALDEYQDMTPLAGAIVAANLHVGGYKGCETVRYLLSLGADTPGGQTPLGLACDHGHRRSTALLALLVAARPNDLERRDSAGFTPLMALIRRHTSLDSVKVLVRAGASVKAERSTRTDAQAYYMFGREGETALACAIGSFNWEVAEYLLENRATLEYGDTCGRRHTVLHLLVYETFVWVENNLPGYMEKALLIANKLLAHDRERDLANEENYHHFTPCDLAIVLALPPLVETFIRETARGVSSSTLELGLTLCDMVTSIDKAPKMFQVDGEELVLLAVGLQCRVPFGKYKRRLEITKAVCERAVASVPV